MLNKVNKESNLTEKGEQIEVKAWMQKIILKKSLLSWCTIQEELATFENKQMKK